MSVVHNRQRIQPVGNHNLDVELPGMFFPQLLKHYHSRVGRLLAGFRMQNVVVAVAGLCLNRHTVRRTVDKVGS